VEFAEGSPAYDLAVFLRDVAVGRGQLAREAPSPYSTTGRARVAAAGSSRRRRKA
jgi:hypothetical protein